jgi:hypothetical protein
MSDPVDTEALRKTARKAGAAIAAVALNGGRIQMRVPADPESDTDLLVTALECDALAAADELDRLRIVLTDAPHDTWCASHDWGNDNHPGDARPCDCWKADVALDGT